MENDNNDGSSDVLIDLSQDLAHVGKEFDGVASGIFGVFLFEKMLRLSAVDQLPISPNRPQLQESLTKVFGAEIADDMMDFLLEEEKNCEMGIFYLHATAEDLSQGAVAQITEKQKPPQHTSRRDPLYDKKFAGEKNTSQRPYLRLVKS